MKTTSSTTLKLVARLAEIIETRKVAEQAEKQLKTELKELMGSEAVLEAGEWLVLIETRNRTDLDKTAIAHDLGQEFLNKYSKRTEYEMLTVKPTKREVKVVS